VVKGLLREALCPQAGLAVLDHPLSAAQVDLGVLGVARLHHFLQDLGDAPLSAGPALGVGSREGDVVLHDVRPDVLYRTYSVQSVCMALGGLLGVMVLRLLGVS
jgi:hypothetical protein